ncbi:MAG: IMP cyclohydrolase, partial [Deltaproteobacteria bacterium]|nr:IMP cyclohydrolase [Deltaproteobacteria bacterium]
MSTTPPSLIKQADYNLSQLSVNPYPGRGILLGRSLDGLRWLQVYWIMGRSENSRNRQFVVEDGVLKTRPLDLSKVKDPSLVIYSAMASLPPWHVVTNGDHTDTIMASLRQGQDYRAALRSREHEPDPPHFTPRIAGGIDASAG